MAAEMTLENKAIFELIRGKICLSKPMEIRKNKVRLKLWKKAELR